VKSYPKEKKQSISQNKKIKAFVSVIPLCNRELILDKIWKIYEYNLNLCKNEIQSETTSTKSLLNYIVIPGPSRN